MSEQLLDCHYIHASIQQTGSECAMQRIHVTQRRSSGRLSEFKFGQFPDSSPAGDRAPTGSGNLGRNQLREPEQFNRHISLAKQTRVGGYRESAEVVFRAEFYNSFNHSQFANRGTTVGSPSFGVIPGTTVAPQLIQFGCKYLF
jgi:hypothetical protein